MSRVGNSLEIRCEGVEYLVCARVSSIWSAVLCQVKGLGLLFGLSVRVLMEFWRSRAEVWLPRRSHSAVSSENQRSTRSIQEL